VQRRQRGQRVDLVENRVIDHRRGGARPPVHDPVADGVHLVGRGQKILKSADVLRS
jgi:hypothetical protein